MRLEGLFSFSLFSTLSLTPCVLFRSSIDIWESPPSALYTENRELPSGCHAMSSGHLLCFWDEQSVLLSSDAPELRSNKVRPENAITTKYEGK